jgi:hypothetical protein
MFNSALIHCNENESICKFVIHYRVRMVTVCLWLPGVASFKWSRTKKGVQIDRVICTARLPFVEQTAYIRSRAVTSTSGRSL